MKMKLSIRTITILSLLFIVTVLFTAVTQFVFSWSADLYKERDNFIKNVLLDDLKELLSYPLAVNDKAMIKRIIDRQLKHGEIHSIEVQGSDNTFVYRSEKSGANVAENFKIVVMDIIDDRPPLDESSANSNPLMGKIIVYLYHEHIAEFIWNSLKDKMLWFCIIFFGVFALLYFVNRHITNSVFQILRNINNISNNGEMCNDELFIVEFDTLSKQVIKLGTEVNQSQVSLLEYMNDLESSRKESEQHLEFKEDFIKTLSHDIRTPINIMNSLLAMVNTSTDSGERFDAKEIEHIKICKSSAEILNNIVNELFDYEQFENDVSVLCSDEVNLEEFFNDFHNLYKEKFTSKKLPFTVVQDELSSNQNIHWITTDKGKLSRIVENLLGNALKFTRNGSVTLVWSVGNGILSFMVKDTGIGIKKDQLEYIFNKYIQGGDVKNSKRGGGRGLGLFYVKSFVSALSGTVKVDTQENRYTHFMVEIPYSNYRGPIEQEGVYSADKNLKSRGGLTAFIIDDDEGNCYTLKAKLDLLNVESKTFCIPDLGYHALKTEMPDIIFIDYYMPGLSGDMLAKRISENKTSLAEGCTWTVCVTQDKDPKTHAEIRGCFDQLITKPLEDEKLKKIVQAARLARQNYAQISKS